MPINVVCIDGHKLFLQGLVNIFKANENINVVGQFNDSKQFLRNLKTLNVDLVTINLKIIDIDGLELCKEIKKFNNKIKVLIITIDDTIKIMRMIKDAGGDGYISKKNDVEELIDIVEKIFAGNTYFPEIKSESIYISKNQPIVNNLTRRELQIAHEILEGKSTKMIAKNLFLSEYTVDTHKKNIYRKLNINSAIELVLLLR